MPKVDLSEKIPPDAKWVKLQYEMSPRHPEAELVARLWSGAMDDAVVIKGREGNIMVRLDEPQTIFYQRPVTVELKLKVVAYKVD